MDDYYTAGFDSLMSNNTTSYNPSMKKNRTVQSGGEKFVFQGIESTHIYPTTPFRSNGKAIDSARRASYPDLSVVVTMSDDDDDHASNEDDPGLSTDERLFHHHDDLPPKNTTNNNESWAMMEQYCDQDSSKGWRGPDTSGEFVTALLDTSLISLPTDFESPRSTPTRRRSRLPQATPRHVLQFWKNNRNTTDTPEEAIVKPLLLSDNEDEEDIFHEYSPSVYSDLRHEHELEANFGSNPTPKLSHSSKKYYVQLNQMEQMLVDATTKANLEAQKRQVAERRAHELECLLSSLPKSNTAASGTADQLNVFNIPSHENLWERNKTLVKEVRFADQTCVELSGQKIALEKEVSLLKQQLNQLIEENAALRRDSDELYRKQARTEADCELYKSRIKTMETITSPVASITVQNQRRIELLESENVAMKQKMEESLVAVAVAEERCTVLNRHAKDFEESQKTHLVQIEQLQQRLSMTVTEKDQLLTELVLARAQLDAKTIEVEQHVQHHQQVSISKDARIAVLEKISTVASQDLQKLQSQVEEFALLKKDMQSQIDALSRQLQATENDLRNHQINAVDEVSNLQSIVQEKEAQLEEASIALSSLQSITQSQNSHIVRSMQASLEHVAAQSENLEYEWSNNLDKLKQRLVVITRAVQHIQESIIFESEETDAANTTSADTSAAESETRSPPNYTQSYTLVNGTMDLELMEEARMFATEASNQNNGEDCSVPHDTTVSSIAGGSLIFSEESTPMMFLMPSPIDHSRSATRFLDSMTSSQIDRESSLNQGRHCIETEDVASIAHKQSFEVLQDRLDELSSKLILTAEEVSSVRGERDHSNKFLNVLNVDNDQSKQSSYRAIEVLNKELENERMGSTILTAKLEAAHEELATLRLSVETLLAQKKASDSHLESMIATLAEDKRNLAELQSLVEAKGHEHGDRQLKLQNSHEMINQLSMDKQALESELGKLRLAVEEIRTDNKDKELRFSFIIDALATAEQNRVDIQNLLESKEVELKGLISQLETSQAALNLVSSENQKLQTDLTKKVVESEESSNNLQIQLSKSKRNEQCLNQTLAEREALELQQKAETENLQREVALKDQELASLSNQLKDLQANLAEMTSSSEECFQQNLMVEKNLSIKDLELQSLKSDLLCLNSRIETTEKEGRRQQEQLLSWLAESKEELTRIDQDKQHMHLDKLKKQAEFDVVRSQLQKQVEELAEYRRKSEEYEVLKQNLHETTETILQSKNKELESLKATLAQFQSQSERSAQYVESLECESQGLHESIHSLETELESLKSSFMQCNERLAQLTLLNEQLEKALDENKRVQEAANELASDTEDRLLKTKNELQQTRAAHQALEIKNEELYTACERLKNDLRLRQAKLHTQEEEFQITTATISSLEQGIQKQIIELQKIKSKAEKDAVDAAYKFDCISISSSNKDKEIETLQIDLKKAQCYSSEISTELTHYSKKLAEQETKIKDLALAKDTADSKCVRLKEYARSLATKCDQWELFYDQEADVLERLKRANDRTRQKVVEIARRYQERDLAYTTERAIWTTERSKWQFVHNELEGELDGIAKELNNFHRFSS